jgi:hypothetical protein
LVYIKNSGFSFYIKNDMARVTSSEKLPKRLDDFLIYQLDHQFVMRKTSGFTKEQLLNDPKYARVKENAAEFGQVSRLCKALRLELVTLLPKQDNLAVCNALTQLMRQVLVCDTVSKRGERQLALALENLESKAIVNGYNFNPNSLFASVFKGSCTYTENGLQFDPFVVSETIAFAGVADYVGLRLHHFGFDFENASSSLASTPWHFFARTSSTNGFVLKTPDANVTSGVKFVLLELQFYTYDGSSYLPCNDRSKVLVVLEC